MKLIGLFLLGRESAYQQALMIEGREAARRVGVKLEVSFGEGQFEVQIKQVFGALSRARGEASALDGMIVMPIKEGGFGRIAMNAARAGISCVFLNRNVDLEAPRREFPRAVLGVVTPDQRQVGFEQGLQCRTWFEESGRARPEGGRRLLYVQGPLDTSSAQDRLAGMRDAAEGWPVALTVVNGEWSEESARAAVSRIAKGPKPVAFEAIVSQNDDMARGARLALGPSSFAIPVFGIDGLAGFGQRMVDEGELAATVVLPLTSGAAVELIAKSFDGAPIPPKVVLPPHWYPDKAVVQERARRWTGAHPA